MSSISGFLFKALNTNNIEYIEFSNESSGKIIYRDESYSFFEVFNNTVYLDLDKKEFQLTLNDDEILFKNITDNEENKYSSISNTYENIEKAILISITILYYNQELGSEDYEDINNPQEPHGLTHWCINPRRSDCSQSHSLDIMRDYCGSEPSYVGDTDCGCLWGDFGCICVTDFNC